jgi:hypothetical protein
MFPALVGTASQGGGAAELALSLNVTATTINVNTGATPPDQTANYDTNPGDADSTASASGGDESYSYAWTISETADVPGANGTECAVLAAGTQNAARYSTATFRATQAALIAGMPPNPTGAAPFVQAVYRLRCTVTDGTGATATADYTVTIAAA